jgi:hypothetical protein
VAIVIDEGHVVHADPQQGSVARVTRASMIDGSAFGPLRVRRRLP